MNQIAIALPQGGDLALDLAGVVGWAYGLRHQKNPWFGTWHLPHIGGEGARYAAFENELELAIARWRPGKMVLESSLPLGALAEVSTYKVVAQQLTLRGIAYSEGWRCSIPVTEISAPSVRKEILGQAWWPKGQIKRVVMAYCHRRGWRVPDHNAGDACLVWEWHRVRMTNEAGPLWREAAE